MIGKIGSAAAGALGGKKKGGGLSKLLKRLQEKLQQAKTPEEREQIKQRFLEKLQNKGKLTPQLAQAIQGL